MFLSRPFAALLLVELLFPSLGIGQENSERLPVPIEPPQHVRFNHMGGEQVSAALAIIQDRKGYMWMGSYSTGLYRYDGYTYRRWVTDPDDSNSLASNGIFALEESDEGGIWIGTETNGLDHYDPTTNTFSHFRHDPEDSATLSDDFVRAITTDANGTLWVGTDSGLNRYDPKSRTFERFHHRKNDSASLSHDRIETVFEDQEGTLWVGTWGLNRYDPVTKTFNRYYPEPNITAPTDRNAGEKSNWVEAIHQDREGRMWIVTIGGGTYGFDPDLGTFRPVSIELSGERGPFGNWVAGIVDDPAGGLFVGTDQGLAWFDPDTERSRHLRVDPTAEQSAEVEVIASLYADRQGMVWVSSGFNGLAATDRSARPFEHITDLALDLTGVSEIHEAPDGILWVSGMNTLNRVDRDRHITTQMRGDGTPHSLPASSSQLGVEVEDDGTLWVGNDQGISYMKPDRPGYFYQLRNDPQIEASLKPGNSRSIHMTADGTLWVGAGNFGISRLEDREAGRFTHFSLGSDVGAITSIWDDSGGHLWVGTSESGLYNMDPQTGHFTRYQFERDRPGSISPGQIYGVCERLSEPGILWIGVYGGGLNRMDTNSGTFAHWTVQNSGLPDNGAQGVLCDGNGDVWVALDIGISRYSPETNTFKNFDQSDGLQDLTFNSWAYHKSPYTGELFFGGRNGVNAFFPDDISDNPHPPEVVISDLKLFGNSVQAGEDSPLRTILSETESFTLRHFQNDVAFDYVGLHFSNPEENQYAYMLEPHDDDWRMVGTQRSASFTNLDPGTYTFRVKAANSDGVWNEEGASVKMIILPPWWRTMWAYLGYALLLIGGVFMIDRTQRQRLIRQEREKTRERELAQAREIERQHSELTEAHESLKNTQSQLIQSEKLASLGQLTSGIAHELKNPLNFVNNFADMNTELADELSDEIKAARGKSVEEVENELIEIVHGLKTNARQIGKHGRRADAIVASMMAHATAGGGERLEAALNPFVEEYIRLSHAAFVTQHPDAEIEVVQNLDPDVGSIRMAPQELGRALMNILSNAMEATQEHAEVADSEYKPKITISAKRDGDKVEIRIADNGPGIPSDVQEKIFEPFFTTKPTGTGTGLGLSLTYDIITQGHGGTLTVESQEGEGASFVVTLPT